MDLLQSDVKSFRFLTKLERFPRKLGPSRVWKGKNSSELDRQAFSGHFLLRCSLSGQEELLPAAPGGVLWKHAATPKHELTWKCAAINTTQDQRGLTCMAFFHLDCAVKSTFIKHLLIGFPFSLVLHLPVPHSFHLGSLPKITSRVKSYGIFKRGAG